MAASLSDSGNIPVEDIKKSLILSELSYYHPEEFKLGLTKQRIIYSDDAFEFINNEQHSTQLYTFISYDVCYVVFRGSQEPLDFLSDSRMGYTNMNVGEGVKVHKGFLMQYEPVKEELHTFLDSHAEEYASIVFTGHSLGAALATLASVSYVDHQRVLEWQQKVVKLYNFGSPRY